MQVVVNLDDKLASERFATWCREWNNERDAGDKFTSFFTYAGTQPTSMWKQKMDREVIMETLRDYPLHCNYNFRKADCDPLRKIKRRIGCILLEEFCATSDEQLLGT